MTTSDGRVPVLTADQLARMPFVARWRYESRLARERRAAAAAVEAAKMAAASKVRRPNGIVPDPPGYTLEAGREARRICRRWMDSGSPDESRPDERTIELSRTYLRHNARKGHAVRRLRES